MNKLRLSFFVATLTFASSAISAEIPPPQVALVSSLYKAFAFEAVLDEPMGPYFIDQPKEVLLRYITPDLFELIHRDRVCTSTTHEICRLDFAPLWGNQDPAGTSVSFKTGPSGDTVVGHMRIGSQSTQLVYSLVQTRAGWRINDITYDNGWTLRKILGAP